MEEADVQLQQAIFHAKAADGRRMDRGEKLLAGARLFDVVRRRMLAGIRSRHPDWGDADLEAEFRRELAIVRGLDGRGVSTPCGSP